MLSSRLDYGGLKWEYVTYARQKHRDHYGKDGEWTRREIDIETNEIPK